jgi:hypothetical protein
MIIGKITAVSGPVVDVEFEQGILPKINEALTVNVNKRHILRDISFGGFGIAILVGVTVLSLVTEDDCGLEVFGEEIGEALTLNKNKKRRK